MNESGRAVRQLIDFFGLPLSDLLVVCDDFNLELARLRMRTGGWREAKRGWQTSFASWRRRSFPVANWDRAAPRTDERGRLCPEQIQT